MVESYVKVSELITVINDKYFTFFSHDTLIRLYNEKYPGSNNKFFNLLFDKWNSNCDDVLKTLSLILLQIKEHLSNEPFPNNTESPASELKDSFERL